MSHAEGPVFVMAEVEEHLQLIDMVQHMFPYLDKKNCELVYKTILECMVYKEHV